MEYVLTASQRGRFEHHIKMGLIEMLHKKNFLTDFQLMEAFRIQEEKDKKYFNADQ